MSDLHEVIALEKGRAFYWQEKAIQAGQLADTYQALADACLTRGIAAIRALQEAERARGSSE